MAKNTMGTKLPRKLEQKMEIVGEQIKYANPRHSYKDYFWSGNSCKRGENISY